MAPLLTELDSIRFAIELEARGAQFYWEAARRMENADQRNLVLLLSGQTNNHLEGVKKILATVQTQKNGSAPEALDAETAAIIQKIGTSLSFPAEAQAAQKVAACTSVSSILEIALQGEKESVQLYEQIANSTKNDEVRKIFTALQSEEQIHVQKLLEMLQGWA